MQGTPEPPESTGILGTVETGSAPDTRHELTFVSHAGEDKDFVRDLLQAMEGVNCAAFFDDDMAVGTPAELEMKACAEKANQAVVVLSRPFLTKMWPMLELGIFLQNRVKIYPLFYRITPDELWDIAGMYDSQAGDDEQAFRSKLESDPEAWRALLDGIALSTRFQESVSLPDPTVWRHHVGEIGKMTGLRREKFKGGESGYIKAVARMVSPPRLPVEIPPLPNQFVKPSRVVDRVVSLLLADAPSGVVLTGMGGAGKSLVASAVAREKKISRRFVDGILWVDDEPEDFSEKRLLDQLNGLAKRFREIVLARHYRQGQVSQYGAVRFKERRQALEYFLMWRNKYNLKCLLVVDSAWSQEVVEAGASVGFTILATTRREDVVPGSSSGWYSVRVPPMQDDESLLVLKNYSGAPVPIPREQALEVAEDCAFLPLALAIAGSTPLVVDDPTSPSAWRTLHHNLKESNKSVEMGREGVGSIHAALTVSFKELGRWQRGHFLKLAVLARGFSASKEMLHHLWDEDPADARVAAKDLVSRSLMQERGGLVRYHVHDMLLDFAKDKIKDHDSSIKEAATSRQAEYLSRQDVILGYFEEEGESNGQDGWLFALMAQWRSVEDVAEDSMLASNAYRTGLVELLDRSEASSDKAKTLGAVAKLFELQGKYADAETLYERALATNEALHQSHHPEVAANANNLAIVLETQGKYAEAERQLARATEIWEKAHGAQHRDVALALNNSARLMYTQGKYDRADQLYLRAIAILEGSVDRDDNAILAAALNNRAKLLTKQGKYSEAEAVLAQAIETWQKVCDSETPPVTAALLGRAEILRRQGKFAEGESLCERALSIDEKMYGPNHPEVAKDLQSLAVLLRDQVKYKNAQPLSERALAIHERTFGWDHPETLKTRVWMANLCIEQGSSLSPGGEVSRLLKEIVESGQRVLGQDHPDVASALVSVGGLLSHQGRYADAEALYTRTMAVLKRSLGRDHPEVAEVLYGQAGALKGQGRYDEAALLYEQSQEIRERALGSDHPDVAQSLNALAVLLESQAEYAKAEPLYERALASREAAFGPDHPDVGMTLNNWAVLSKAQGNYKRAESLHARAVTIGEKALGPRHPKLATWLSNQAGLFRVQGKDGEADVLYARAIAIGEEALGSEHPDLAAWLCNRATLFVSQGKYSEADSLYQRGLAIDEKAYGRDHPEVAADLNNIGSLLAKQDKHAEAAMYFARAVEIWDKTLGPDHPNLAVALSNLAEALGTQGKYEDAEPLSTRTLAIAEKVYGPRHLTVATYMRIRVQILVNQERYSEAEDLYARLLAIQEEHLGSGHTDVAVGFSNRAALLRAQTRYEEAEWCYSRAIAIGEKALGPEDPTLVAWLVNRAGLLKMLGKLDDADALFARAAVIGEKVWGMENPNLAVLMNNRAGLLKARGKYDDADLLYRRAIEIDENAYGCDHPEVATVLSNLAALLQMQGKSGEAEPLYARAVEILETNPGQDHPGALAALNNLVSVMGCQGKHDEAEISSSRALAIAKKVYRPGQREFAAQVTTRAKSLMVQRRHDEAVLLLEETMAVMAESLGKTHEHTVSVAFLLQDAQKAQMAYKETTESGGMGETAGLDDASNQLTVVPVEKSQTDSGTPEIMTGSEREKSPIG